MEKKRENGKVEMNFQPGRKFARWNELLNAASEIVAVASEQNATVTLRARKSFGEADVVIYCSPEFRISELEGARYTEKKIESREFYAEDLRENLRIRTLSIYFKLT